MISAVSRLTRHMVIKLIHTCSLVKELDYILCLPIRRRTWTYPLDVRDSKVDIPIFANIRCNLLKNKVSPFVDVKGGTYVTNAGGLYVNASVGCRFPINEKQAINLSVGYATEKLQFETFDSFINHTNMDYTRFTTLYDTEAVTIKVGFEF